MRDLREIPLDGQHSILTGRLPPALVPDAPGFEALWALRPPEPHPIVMFGRPTVTPRWQKAFGRDYRYTGTTNAADPVPPLLRPLLGWSQEILDPRLNGLLLNWYDGALGHYIGPHRDRMSDMVEGSPILTLSFGETRLFRLRPWRSSPGRSLDLDLEHGSVLVIPFETNRCYTHSVPRAARYRGRRVSVTIRAFR